MELWGTSLGLLTAHLVQVLSLGASNSLYKEVFFFFRFCGFFVCLFNGAWKELTLMSNRSNSSNNY